MKIQRVLVANRGEIACRIIRSCKANGLTSIAVFSNEDADSLHVTGADESIPLSGVGASAYINTDEIVSIAVASKADVVVPGYGFLSENGVFASALEKAGIIFAGPSGDSVEKFGLKHSARELAEQSGVPIVPGTKGLVGSVDDAIAASKTIGFPIMVKSTAGGGGMGLKIVRTEAELASALAEVESRGKTLFQNSGAFLEKYIEAARHIEVQVFGNGAGDVVAFGERECSIQRRHQKVIEEAPSSFVTPELRSRLVSSAIALASAVKYKSAGTVEFIVDDTTGQYYFLEMNTRLQVEHGITELVYKVDLVQLMLLQADYEARGETGIPFAELESAGLKEPDGHAIEVRVYAENPVKNFQPSPGILHLVEFPQDEGLRIDHWVSTGTKVSPYFDPLLAKIMFWGASRSESIDGMLRSLQKTKIFGPTINLDYLVTILDSQDFRSGYTLTSTLNKFQYEPNLIEFIEAGAYTTVQDLPGRDRINGGVPLSGPMDTLHFQLANILVGNERSTAAFEITFKGPKIKFHTASVISLSGGDFSFKVNKAPAPMNTAIFVPAGSVVRIKDATGAGARAYLAIKGGLPEVATYLGSKACTPTLSLGGHQGRMVLPGDCFGVERIGEESKSVTFGPTLPDKTVPVKASPDIEQGVWTIKVTSGPHESAEICDYDKLVAYYNTLFKVNLNSNRGATRLDCPGPVDVFSRVNGGDGGSHPSNILEYIYPTCGVSIVGSMACLFGVDGATLSGFVCLNVPVWSDWWKNGQAPVGSSVKFVPVSYEKALALNAEKENFLDGVELAISGKGEFPEFKDDTEPEDTKALIGSSLLYHRAGSKTLPELNIRQAGEKMLVVDFGISKFTLVNSGRQKMLETKLLNDLRGRVAESLMRVECSTSCVGVVFDYKVVSRDEVIKSIVDLEKTIPEPRDLKIKSTVYKLPCCFEHSALSHCVERYMHSQRSKAPYLPNVSEFIMRANRLNNMDELKANVIGQRQVVTAASFLCGNTLSVNLDPRTRFASGKMNPARTFTPKGALGSGSVGYSIYPVDSPGGYMVWGMVLPDLAWNTFGRLNVSKNGRPWFFDNFEQIEYYEVSEAELDELNRKLLTGKLALDTEEAVLDFGQYIDFLDSIEPELEKINAGKAEATAQLAAEEEASLAEYYADLEKGKTSKGSSLVNDPSVIKVTSTMAANVFKINVRRGDVVSDEDILVILEAMKMEIYVRAAVEEDSDDDDDENPKPKKQKIASFYDVLDIVVNEGDVVNAGDALILIKAK